MTPSPTVTRRPTAARKSTILGPDGKPATSYLYPSPRGNHRQYRPRRWLQTSTRKNVTSFDRAELVNLSRQLFGQIDVLSAAVNDKNNWAFGDAWDAHFVGADKEWGREAERFLNEQWMPNANVRGAPYDFKRSMLLSGIALDVDGDDIMVLTQNASGFPQLAFYPATKCNTRATFGTDSETVAGGPFDGARIFDGIIFDRNSRMIGVRIFGDDDKAFEDISSFNADLAYEPQWCDQARGIPKIATGLLRWMNLQDIDEFIQKGVKRAASVGLITKNEEGEAPVGNEIITGEENLDGTRSTIDGGTVSDRKVAYEEIDGGEMYYLSAPGGESIEALKFENPHPNTEAFVERIARGCLASIGWFAELLDLGATGRAPARILCDLANQSIWSRQRTMYRRWKRAVGYAVAVGMKNGYIPRNDAGIDAYQWEPGLPKPISVDAGNDAQADREALKLGLTTRAIVSQKMHGLHWRAVDMQREQELRSTIETAKAINQSFPEVSFDRALELLEQRSPNPIAQAAQSQKPQASTQTQKPAAARSIVLNMPAPGRMKFIRDEEDRIIGSEPDPS